ncbi:MAG TPA: Rid family detoxifying hydrolase [Gaiellaceae bacterium]|nr:Rid family detoxifying hydrolase [Gaiellaceae bacterium]
MTERQAVRTEDAPAPFQGAPYSQAIAAGQFVFVSGQVGVRAGESQPVSASVAEQTEQALANLGAILAAAGSGLDRIVKTTVYLSSLADFAEMNEAYRRQIPDPPPARATVGAELPGEFRVEIEAVALI